ncbi:MAG: HAD-IIB family hydrolase [Olsenella sp.]|nr:HAD-IIB family hydrolase [Olsenella sp.]
MATSNGYDLIALDMDGTLLDPEKSVTDGVAQALEQAARAGKTIVLATGRCVSELAPYRDALAPVRYAICESGALLYDLGEERVLASWALPPEVAPAVAREAAAEGAMVQGMSRGIGIAQRSHVPHMDRWKMGIYRPLYEETATLVDDMNAELNDPGRSWEKLNVFHLTPESRERGREALRSLPVVFAYMEETSLEITAEGIDKGRGLLELCRILGIDPARTVGVGDGANDEPLLQAAGLAVAMGNATPEIAEMADATVADTARDGAAEAIRRFLL